MSAREKLCCGLDHLELDLRQHRAVLRLPPGHCTDMGGAIAVVTAIDPECRRIYTIAGAAPDTMYKRSADGEWRAYDARKRHAAEASA